tara:strand:+ start:159 stop:1265 length:1107 start_codon:yes stop_codon:yes gene_type:complete
MVRTCSKTETIQNLHFRNTDVDCKNNGNGISIASDFQRGDEETGVWCLDFQQTFIDSAQRGYPIGIITLVKDHVGATAYQDPWKVLDGGNRMRSIRDYTDDKFTDLNGKKYSQLTDQERANFNTILIPVQELTIERKDPASTISNMFIRLNTKTNVLQQGELLKAHGHRQDVWQIEMAKKFVGDCWTSTISDNVDKTYGQQTVNISILRNLWTNAFGILSETKRSDNLAMMTGFIISACTNNFVLFDKRYAKLEKYLSPPGDKPTSDNYNDIYSKLYLLLNIMNSIHDKSIIRPKKGMPPQTKIAPIWKIICEDKLTDEARIKIINFYNSLNDNIDRKNAFLNLGKGTNGETGPAKTQLILNFILSQN